MGKEREGILERGSHMRPADVNLVSYSGGKDRENQMEQEPLVTLDEDQKAVALIELQELHRVASYLYESVKKDQLTEEMRRVLCSLCEAHTTRAAEILGYDLDLTEEREKRYVEIRTANMRIHELEKQLGCCDITNVVPKKLQLLSRLIRDWWGMEGFGYVSDIRIYHHFNQLMEL